jgi:hypothetical protein
LVLVLFDLVALLLHLFNLVLEHFDVQFELLFDLDMVANFELILLKLLFVFLGREIE